MYLYTARETMNLLNWVESLHFPFRKSASTYGNQASTGVRMHASRIISRFYGMGHVIQNDLVLYDGN